MSDSGNPIRIKLDSQHIASLLAGQEIEVKDFKGQLVHIIASDDGVNVYREACNRALDKVERNLRK